MPLRSEAATAFKGQFEAFRRKFGRDPAPDDPIIFDPTADTPQPLAMDAVQRQIVEVMAATGIEPSFIYAFVKTGIILTEMNQDKLSPEQLAEWDAVIAEYEQKTKGKFQ